MKPKILYLDIENSRMWVKFPTYKLWDIARVDPKYIVHDWYITCAAWAWLDNEKQKIGRVHAVAVNDFPSYKNNFRDDRGVVKKLHEVISQADLIVGHNSDSFDIKKINEKIVKYSLPALDFPPTVDTLKANKKYRKSSSNSLAYLARDLGVPTKIELPSGVMWAADGGCEKSLKKLVRYNKGDIIAGASVYFKLLPYIKNHPNIAKVMGKQARLSAKNDVKACGSCGSNNIIRNGYRATKSGPRQRWLCYDCGSSTLGKLKPID